MGRLTRTNLNESPISRQLVNTIQKLSQPISGPKDLTPLLDRIGDASYVLLGEASHGTAEYYRWRAEITKRLITEKGFSIIAVEGDWPDCYRVNQYIRGLNEPKVDAREALAHYERWPTWMWANEEIADLVDWLRRWNAKLPETKKIGFYGLDVYSLWESLYQIMGYLSKTDGKALEAARKAFRCFEPYGEEEHQYAQATRWVPETCENEVVDLLWKIRSSAPTHSPNNSEARFVAEQNAIVLKNAEAYYRAMVRSGPESWNIRDRHMAETLDRLVQFYGNQAKAIVWEHNTHIGDARFTDMIDDGTINLGQLVRERYGEGDVVLVGFGSYQGTVIASQEWGNPWERMRLPPARSGSWEDAFHTSGTENRLLVFEDIREEDALYERRGHRAVGVVYRPPFEHLGNYVPTILPRRYDAFLYFDATEALHPLPTLPPTIEDVPETFPTGV